MVEFEKGIVRVSENLTFRPGYTFDDFKKCRHYRNQDGIRAIYLDEQADIDGRSYAVEFFFRNGIIHTLSLICLDRDYTEEDEPKRKELFSIISKAPCRINGRGLWIMGIWGNSFERGALLGHEFLIVGNLVVQPFHGGFELVVLLLQAGALLYQDFLAGCFRAFLEEQLHVFDEGFHLHAGAAHAFGKLHPAAGLLIKIPDAVLLAGYMGYKADALIIAYSIGRDIVFLADFLDGHEKHLANRKFLLIV
jgi:hypothetical protein